MFRRAGLLFICMLLAGCVASRPDRPNALSELGAKNQRQVLAQTKVVPDAHAGWTEVLGPAITQYRPHSTVRYMALTRLDGDKVAYQIQAQGLFPKRVYLGAVYSEGRKLKSKLVDRERTYCGYGCTTVETVAVFPTEREMEVYAAKGLIFEVIGRRDSIVVSIPASYFTAVLEKHRRELGSAVGAV